jgi:molybdopterin-synthase adenylyltransferase
MDDPQLLRYSRQILLPQFGIEGQQALLDSHALIIGAGGLGSPAALYLAAAGIGRLSIADDDAVEASNLQRQILHREQDIGRPKAESAQDHLRQLNPGLQVEAITERLQGAALEERVRAADLVLDCSDNFTTRFAINAACVRQRKPLVSGAAIRLEGQVAVFDLRDGDRPCYRCLYREEGELEETCAENGVLGPLVGIIGSIQALEAIKLLTGMGETLAGRLLILDGTTMEWREMKLRKDPECPECGRTPGHATGNP